MIDRGGGGAGHRRQARAWEASTLPTELLPLGERADCIAGSSGVRPERRPERPELDFSARVARNPGLGTIRPRSIGRIPQAVLWEGKWPFSRSAQTRALSSVARGGHNAVRRSSLRPAIASPARAGRPFDPGVTPAQRVLRSCDHDRRRASTQRWARSPRAGCRGERGPCQARDRDDPGRVPRLDARPRTQASRSNAPDVCRALQPRATPSPSDWLHRWAKFGTRRPCVPGTSADGIS